MLDAAARVHNDAFIIIEPPDIRKTYAEKMRLIARLVGDRHLIFSGQHREADDLARGWGDGCRPTMIMLMPIPACDRSS